MTPTGPWASIRPSRRAARDQARRDDPTPGGGDVWVGTWRLSTSADGDLVATHTDGTVRVLATIDEE
ncbi:hypothetical protein IL38_24070 [Actinopolyspora erythraea]|uniref:Lipocalin-like domain-containing protein n=1 Tax=Actinopolyspora erythraea TaxID=414996 RepID=A0ABR4WYB2_9ACTN|nr:hypothetical protein [Actinopolyspora erythraea]KGI79376.1 hypothetical protein IL38_24070 [Actinopolyspora erythraea]